MKFIDQAIIDVRSGDGAPGMISFMRQSHMPKMGPDGGNGGKGGDVYFVASTNIHSLLDFKFEPRYFAENGIKGGTADKDGRYGEDLTIEVPVGTQLIDQETGDVVADLVIPGEPILLMKGGRGGLGNMNFATPTRQAPDFAQPGLPGVRKMIRLELKLMADVGLVGFPNAGKSTLISRVSAAKPKIADYPFTTLVPNLGVVRGKGRDFVIADIPGIIEGAAEGRGLGLRFLKHCERTRFLLMLLDGDPTNARDLAEEYQILDREIAAYSPELAAKPRMVVVNKLDALTGVFEEKGFEDLRKLVPDVTLISAVTGEGLEDLLVKIVSRLNEIGAEEPKNIVTPPMSWGDDSLFERDVELGA